MQEIRTKGFGRHSLFMVAALGVALLLIVGAWLAMLLGARPGLPSAALGCGLAVMALVMLFLWKALGLSAGRCADLERARAAQEAEAARFRTALDALDDGILVMGGDGNPVLHNRPFETLWGLPGPLETEARAGFVPDPMADPRLLAQLKDPEAWLARAAETRQGASRAFDAWDLWDGRVVKRYSRPLPDGLGRFWRFRDVTARVKADRFVHRVAQVVEQSPVTIVITDTAGNLEFVNPRFTQLTGYALEEALGQNPRILKSGLTPPKVFQELWATITAGDVWVGEFQNQKKDGSLFWERATISPLRDPDGVITHYLGLKEDITHQKQLEHQLRHAQKLEAVGLLASGVAHDFNNILQVINGYGTLVQMGQAPDDPHRKAIAEVLKAAERAAQLTHSLLAFSRKQVMNPRTVDLNTTVGTVEKLLRRILGEDVQIEVARAATPLMVHVDLGQIEQVLLNLATNARDAMPKGGCLAITTGLAQLDENFMVEHHFGKPGPYALLEVRDEGVGMDEATRKRIFEPFFTTKELGRGTGLGLAMVYGIIKQHNGYILVESVEGEGTTFQVYLPMASSVPAEEAEPALQDRMKGTETILVAEDEPAVRGIVEIILRKYGYTVLLAEDGQLAVEQFQAHRASIHMVLMDIIMPGKSGQQACAEIRRECPDVKVLFTSGYPADFIKSRGDLEQGMELLMKPVQPLALLRKVREILDRA
jgi:two-component system NtrC family sensor kinase